MYLLLHIPFGDDMRENYDGDCIKNMVNPTNNPPDFRFMCNLAYIEYSCHSPIEWIIVMIKDKRQRQISKW